MKDPTGPETIQTPTGDSPAAQVDTHFFEHPVGAGIGAVLAAGTAGAAVGLIAGPLAAVVGTVVGAVAGGVGGQAIAELIVPTSDDNGRGDTYTKRVHHTVHGPETPHDDEPLALERRDLDSSDDGATKEREAWKHLDHSNKEIIRDNESFESDDL